MIRRWIRVLPLLTAALALLHPAARGWVYPEHRGIAFRGIVHLDADRRIALERIWAEARRGYESRLTPAPADTTGEDNPTAIDYAGWPAIAGDHSCSPENMLHNILQTGWILEVATVAARLNSALTTAGLEPHARTNALRDADLALLRADPAYATRAGANNSHFLLARPDPGTDAETYIDVCLANGCELNALGTYAWCHFSALQKADRLSRSALTDSARREIALGALADEAFAIHFLSDAFAAGHVAGTRGDASLRKGTHDYYNEHGLEVRTWQGESMVLRGDAWMRPQDAERASLTVQKSLEQFLDAFMGRVPSLASLATEPQLTTPDTFNTCELVDMPLRQFPGGVGSLLKHIIRETPVPGLTEGEGEYPRFRSEVGPFIGVVPAVRGGLVSGGFGEYQNSLGAIGGLEVAVRLGLGLDGVLNESGDGLVFLDLGLRLDAASSTPIVEDPEIQRFGAIFAATPSRGAITGRLRVPFWLLPFDLLVMAPFLATTSPGTYTTLATVAGNGGLIPWQAGMATSVGRFQFVLGREVGISFYGYVKSADRFLIPYGDPDPQRADGALASLRSIQLEFPVIEYMPFRTFSSDQSSSLVVQLYGSVDMPTSVSDIFPDDDPPLNLKNVWQVGLRAAFRWRYYW
jgi:hypothetical protein